MAEITFNAGASPANSNNWEAIDWQTIVATVRRLQMRIAKAYREGKYGKAKALQRLLTCSYHAKLLAVKRVVQNKGAKTPGVDGITWSTPKQRMNAALSLKRRDYKTQPLKRIYILKRNGKKRPLSIPPILCRAQQSLYLLALDPIVETIADPNSYGFRPLRSTADAIAQCFTSLCRRTSSQYILEGDIKGCFDNIDKTWLCNNIPTDKVMLKKWLDAGYLEDGRIFPTERGIGQGGIISPSILVITLSGLEAAVKAAVKPKDKVNVCVYADDFIITGATPEILEHKVKPVVITFLKERGLSLSKEKTKISHINKGFDFLGMNIRKYNSKCIIKPAKSSVKRFLADIREIIKKSGSLTAEELILRLNLKIRGWVNYYQHVCAKRTFSIVDCALFRALWRWCLRRHPNKNKKWVIAKYFHRIAFRSWIFSAKVTKKNTTYKGEYSRLISAARTPIKRYVKIRASAIPYNPAYQSYFKERLEKRKEERQNLSSLPGWWWLWEDALKLQNNKAGSPTVAL